MDTRYEALANTYATLLSAEHSNTVDDAQLLSCYKTAVQLRRMNTPHATTTLPCRDTCVFLWHGERTDPKVREIVRTWRKGGAATTPLLTQLLALRPPGAASSTETLCSILHAPCNTVHRMHVADEWTQESAQLLNYAVSVMRGRILVTWLTQLPAPTRDTNTLVLSSLKRMPSYAAIVHAFYKHSPDDGILEAEALAAIHPQDTLPTVMQKTLAPVLRALPPHWQSDERQAEAQGKLSGVWQKE
jgi:hypothetical protein